MAEDDEEEGKGQIGLKSIGREVRNLLGKVDRKVYKGHGEA